MATTLTQILNTAIKSNSLLIFESKYTTISNRVKYFIDKYKFELQDYKEKELIIVYSKSNDGTDNYLDSLKKKYKIIP